MDLLLEVNMMAPSFEMDWARYSMMKKPWKLIGVMEEIIRWRGHRWGSIAKKERWNHYLFLRYPVIQKYVAYNSIIVFVNGKIFAFVFDAWKDEDLASCPFFPAHDFSLLLLVLFVFLVVAVAVRSLQENTAMLVMKIVLTPCDELPTRWEQTMHDAVWSVGWFPQKLIKKSIIEYSSTLVLREAEIDHFQGSGWILQ